VLTPARFKLAIAVVFLSLLCFLQSMSANTLDSARDEFAGTKQMSQPCSTNTSSAGNRDCDQDNSAAMLSPPLGQRGSLIAQVRELTLEILQSDNTCSAWFEEADPDAADVFRSLRYYIETNGTSDIYSIRDNFGDLYFMHPWGARTREYAGKNSFILINANGPFFIRKSRVIPSDPKQAATSPIGSIPVLMGPYTGATPEAQITIMLHELGHITGRLPEDNNSWDGSSSRNTSEVLRHCKKEIHQVARKARNEIQVQANSSGASNRLESAAGE